RAASRTLRREMIGFEEIVDGDLALLLDLTRAADDGLLVERNLDDAKSAGHAATLTALACSGAPQWSGRGGRGLRILRAQSHRGRVLRWSLRCSSEASCA